MMRDKNIPDEDDNKKDSDKTELSGFDKLKLEIKEPTIVAIMTLILLLPQSNSLITVTNISMLLNVDGSINLYGLIIKALIAGILFYAVKKYMN